MDQVWSSWPALLLIASTLASNPYASSAVRVQHDRDQQVISHGPYGIVRHPMYLSGLIVCVGGGAALGSWYAGLALQPLVPIFVRRTLVEDARLHRELAGYAAYAGSVRRRTVPGVF